MEVRRSPEVERFAEDAHRAFEQRDEDWRARHTAEGEVVMFGTDPEEIWRGRDVILGFTQAQVDEMNEAAGIKYERDSVEGYDAGDNGFYISTGRFVLADGSAFPARSVTFVAKEHGDWKVLMGGMSLLVPNDLLTAGSPLAKAAAPA